MLFSAVRVLSACAAREKTWGESEKPVGLGERVFRSGDVLLSHDLSSHYHRGCSVSLPCSEWERVVPLRDDHQRSEPEWRFDASRRRRTLMTMSIGQRTSGSLISTHRFSEHDPPRRRTLQLRLSFSFEII